MRELKYNDKGYIVDTIYDKEVVRWCDSNIAKMKIHEWCYYRVFHQGIFGEAWSLISEQGLEVFKNLFYLTVNVVAVILTPVILPISAHNSIKRAKEEVARNEAKRNTVRKGDE